MSDISFGGLGSLVLYIITASLFGILLFSLFIRHILLTCESKLNELKTNGVLIGASLFPFVCSALGITLLIFYPFSIETKVLIDKYISWMTLLASLLIGIIYIILKLKKEKA